MKTNSSENTSGYLAVILNAHSPYLKSPLNKDCPEEYWVFSQILDSYMPLLDTFERLLKDGIFEPVIFSLSPSLLEMLADEDMQNRFIKYLDNKLILIDSESERCMFESGISSLLEHYKSRIKYYKNKFVNIYNKDIISAFASLHQAGVIKLITTCATSAVLPMLSSDKSLCRAQIEIGLQTFSKYFGFKPSEFWLPECAFVPGLEDILTDAGITGTHVSVSSSIGASPYLGSNSYYPFKSGSGLTFYPNDMSAASEVWSGKSGYYTAFSYRNSTRDISDDMPDLDLSCLGTFTSERPITGLKYYSNGLSNGSDIYNIKAGNELAKLHAQAFIDNRIRAFSQAENSASVPPLASLSLNAEFLGHNWYEGCIWLEHVIRMVSQNKNIKMICPEDYGNYFDKQLQYAVPNAGSWLDGGFMSRWVNRSNDWIYRNIGLANKCFMKMAKAKNQSEDMKRSIDQALRFLLIVQSSDWPLMLSVGHHASSARKQVRNGLIAFYKLYEDFLDGNPDPESLQALENRTPLFKDIHYSRFFNAESEENKLTNSTDKQHILQCLNKLNTVSGSVFNLCRDTEKSKDASCWKEITEKIVEAVKITESLAADAKESKALNEYNKAAADIRCLLKNIMEADTAEEAFKYDEKSAEIISSWTNAAADVIKEQLNRKG